MALLVFGRALLAVLCCVATVASAGLPAGKSVEAVTIGGEIIQVHYYKPATYNGGPLLVSFHGLTRNVEGYLDAAIPLAERHGMLVVGPLFDIRRYPNWRYQNNGITRQARDVASGDLPVEPHAQWTSEIVRQLIDHVRVREGQAKLPYYLLGHSAGGQFANRIAAFTEHGALRVIVANPSSYVWPTLEARFPYGYGGLPVNMANESELRRYLAQPMTLLLGTADVKVTPDLDTRPPAMLQGATRHERGLNVFRAAQALARDKGWIFNWKLIEVPGVGHSAPRMYGGPQAAEAFTSLPAPARPAQ